MPMMYRYSICDPLHADVLEMGQIPKESVLEIFDEFPWVPMLAKMEGVGEQDIYFSPSLEFENKLNQHGISISALGDVGKQEFMIFYKRPKMVPTWLGLSQRMENNYLTERDEQTLADAREAIIALINGDLETLEERWG